MSESETPVERERGAISVARTETSPVLHTLEVEVDARRVARAFDRAYHELARKVRLPGFRPGKAPRSVLERRYGASLAEEIERSLVAETLPEAVEQSGLEPVAEPSVDSQVPRCGEAFHYRVDIEVRPPIELPELHGLPARRPRVEVSEADVERELEALRERRAPLVEEPEGARARPGSLLTIDYEGRIDGEPFEGGSAEGASVELGSGRFLPGFEEQLEGARVGEEREVRVTFPEDYPAADVAGRNATFVVRIRAARRRELPELDDAFAQQLGEEFQSLAELRQRIREDLERSREQAARREARRSLLDALIERTHFQVPPGMVERRLNQQLAMAHQQLQGELEEEELHQRLATWQEQWRPEAEREVRETLLLDAVAEARSLEVGDEDVEQRLRSMAQERGLAPERLRKSLSQRGLLGSLRADLRREKALEFLLSEAKIEETAGS